TEPAALLQPDSGFSSWIGVVPGGMLTLNVTGEGDFTLDVRLEDAYTPDPVVICQLTAEEPALSYVAPTTDSPVFSELPAGLELFVLARTPDGWTGFNPGVAQPGLSGTNRLRWAPPDSPITLGAGCDAVPTITQADIDADMELDQLGFCQVAIGRVVDAYRLPQEGAAWLGGLLPGGEYTAVATTPDGWVGLRMRHFSPAASGLGKLGWVRSDAISLAGCGTLTTFTQEQIAAAQPDDPSSRSMYADACLITLNNPLDAYADPSAAAEPAESITAGTRLLYLGNSAGGWHAVDTGSAAPGETGPDRLRWLAPSAGTITYSDPCQPQPLIQP
ncbi:MAG: hypothetical protein GYB64_12110, partial [Chloroflexi bacterium]|nr:hypothetical protein [Chloroflexota bacterium]